MSGRALKNHMPDYTREKRFYMREKIKCNFISFEGDNLMTHKMKHSGKNMKQCTFETFLEAI